jgi:hypothetical protein
VARSGNDLVMPSQKASPIRAARFSLGDEPPVVRVEWVDVDVMASAEAASTAEGIAFGLHPDCGMSRDDLALDAVAFSARAVLAALASNRSRCEATFPIECIWWFHRRPHGRLVATPCSWPPASESHR